MSFDEDQENVTTSSDFDVSDFLEERRKRKESFPRRLIPALEDYVRRHFLPERNGGQPLASQMMVGGTAGAAAGARLDGMAGAAGARPDGMAGAAAGAKPNAMMGAPRPDAMKASVGIAVNAFRDETAEDEEKTPPKKKTFGLFRKAAEKPAAMPKVNFEAKTAKKSAARDSVLCEEVREYAKKAERTDYDLCEAEAEWDVLAHESAINERMTHLSDTYQQYLFYLIESKGMSNAEVYKRAIVDKKVFAKIKANPDYHPKKMTALCLCVGAKLNLDETRDLLARAGYALSPCDKTDVIFSYFIENEIYDMIEIDIQLEEHGLPCIIA